MVCAVWFWGVALFAEACGAGGFYGKGRHAWSGLRGEGFVAIARIGSGRAWGSEDCGRITPVEQAVQYYAQYRCP